MRRFAVNGLRSSLMSLHSRFQEVWTLEELLRNIESDACTYESLIVEEILQSKEVKFSSFVKAAKLAKREEDTKRLEASLEEAKREVQDLTMKLEEKQNEST